MTSHFYLVIKKPSSLISKLAKRKSQLSVPAAEVQAEVADMTDQQRSAVRKKCKEKVGVVKASQLLCSMFYSSIPTRRKSQRRLSVWHWTSVSLTKPQLAV